MGPSSKSSWATKLTRYASFSHLTVASCLFVYAQESHRQVPTAEAAAFAEKMGCQFVETSAKTAVGVRQAFRDVVERIVENPDLRVIFKPSPPQASFARPQPPHFFSH
jgi:Ras-related protein Rab-18